MFPTKFQQSKVLSMVAGLTAAAVTLASTTTPPASAAPSKVTDILFWAGHDSGQLHTALIKEVEHFNATHPTIHVTFQAQHATAKGMAAFLAHKAPNVAMVATNAAQTFISGNALLNLKPFISSKNGLTTQEIQQDYYPVIWQDMQDGNGKQYLMPLEKKSGVVLYYNEDLMKRAHIASAPKTWAQVVTDATKITNLGSKYHGIEWTPSVRQFFVMAMDFGGSVWSNANHTKFNLNNSGARKAFTMLRDMVKKNILIPTKGYNYQLDFGTGKVGMLIDASAGYTYDLGSVGGKFPMLAQSAPKGPVGHAYNYINGASLAMFNTGSTAQQEASWIFTKWMSAPSNNTYWNEHTNYLPLGPLGMKKMRWFYAKNPAYKASFSNPNYWVIKPTDPNYSAAKTAMQSDFLKGLMGQESINTALSNMTNAGNKYMAGQQRL